MSPAPPSATSRRSSTRSDPERGPRSTETGWSRQPLLEPVVGVRLVVERRDLLVSGRPVEADRLDERLVRLEPDDPAPGGLGMTFELGEEAPADAQATGRRGDPHPLELGRVGPVELERATPDGLTAESGDEEDAGRRPELGELGGKAARRVEPGGEPRVELTEVGTEAELGVLMRGVHDT